MYDDEFACVCVCCIDVVYGSALIAHCLLGAGLKDTVKIGSGCDPEKGFPFDDVVVAVTVVVMRVQSLSIVDNFLLFLASKFIHFHKL